MHPRCPRLQAWKAVFANWSTFKMYVSHCNLQVYFQSSVCKALSSTSETWNRVASTLSTIGSVESGFCKLVYLQGVSKCNLQVYFQSSVCKALSSTSETRNRVASTLSTIGSVESGFCKLVYLQGVLYQSATCKCTFNHLFVKH